MRWGATKRIAQQPRAIRRRGKLDLNGASSESLRERHIQPICAGLVRVAHAGSSYLSSEDQRLLFGLGDATSVREVVVRYPDGRTARIRDVRADRLVEAG